MVIFPLELVREKPRFLGCLPQKQDEKIAMCESWCYSHHNTVDSTLVLSAFVTKNFGAPTPVSYTHLTLPTKA